MRDCDNKISADFVQLSEKAR